MAFGTLPKIQLPWSRRTSRFAGIEIPRIGLPRFDGRTVDRTVERIKAGLQDVDASKIAETSAATVAGAVDDARRVVAEGAGQVAERATEIGQEAGKLGKQIAATGESNIRSLGTDIRELARDVKSLRIAREKQRPDIMPGIALLAGLGTGLAAMFFFDPEQGRRRRALLRDQITKGTRIARETISGRVRDLRNRSTGLAHEMGAAGAGGAAYETASDIGSTPYSAEELERTDTAATGMGETETSIYSTSAVEAPIDGEGALDEGERERVYGSYPETGSRETTQ